MDNNIVSYSTNAEGVIIEIGDSWYEFAQSNEGESLNIENIIGKNLFKYIQGNRVKHIYETMHDIVMNNSGRQISFNYRCDSPQVNRYMKMELEADRDKVLYRSTIIKEVPSTNFTTVDYNSNAGQAVVMCSWCKDFQFPQGKSAWKALDTIFEYIPEQYVITHGICPKCQITFKTELDNLLLSEKLK